MGFNWKELDRYEAKRDAEIARKKALRAEKNYRTGYLHEVSVAVLAIVLFFFIVASIPAYIERGDMEMSVVNGIGVGIAIGLIWWFLCRKKDNEPDEEEQETDSTGEEEYPTTRYNSFRR